MVRQTPHPRERHLRSSASQHWHNPVPLSPVGELLVLNRLAPAHLEREEIAKIRSTSPLKLGKNLDRATLEVQVDIFRCSGFPEAELHGEATLQDDSLVELRLNADQEPLEQEKLSLADKFRCQTVLCLSLR